MPEGEPPVVDLAELGDLLVASDRAYFGLAASVDQVGPAEVVWMPGLTGVPAGCVAWVDPGADPESEDGGTWVDDTAQHMRELGTGLVRIYCSTVDDETLARLVAGGFTRRRETGFLAGHEVGTAQPAVSLRPAGDEAGWTARQALYRRADLGSDGHGPAPGGGLAALERRKCDTGSMTPYLVEVGGEVAGAVATLSQGRLLRLKNLYLAPEFRGRGIGSGVVRRVWELVADGPWSTLGALGVAGTRGAYLYAGAGLTPSAELIEWSRPARLTA